MTLGDLIADVLALAGSPVSRATDTSGHILVRQGGSAANVAREVVRAGGAATFIGAVGRDPWGGQLTHALRGAGVDVHVVVRPQPTARIVALVEPDGERTFVTDRGAADELRAGDVRIAWLRGASALHLPAYSLFHGRPLAGAARRAAGSARSGGGAVTVDLASSGPILALGAAEAWRRVADVEPDVLFGNAAETAAVLDGRPETDLLRLARIVVIKLGAAGCRVLVRPVPADGPSARASALPRVLAVSTRSLESRDTTGAGDAFAAGFLVSWLRAPGEHRHSATVLRAAARAGHRAAYRLLRTADRAAILA